MSQPNIIQSVQFPPHLEVSNLQFFFREIDRVFLLRMLAHELPYNFNYRYLSNRIVTATFVSAVCITTCQPQ